MTTRYLLILITATLITSCVPPVEKVCGYKKEYIRPYYNSWVCGPKITYRCDKICDQCKAAEPACSACYACINSESCGTDCNY